MIAELLLIGKLLGKTDLSKSTPSPVVRPKLFGRNGNGTDRIPKPPTKKGPALELKKFF
jgi:hypothetical protein